MIRSSCLVWCCAIVWAAIPAFSADSVPSFVNDVEPVLTRFGCNQGACHGKGAGQNGFRLSLRGYAPELDHGWIVKEQEGRRVSLVAPEDSLLLRKPLGEVPHGGAKLFDPGSKAHQILLEWLKAGAPGPVKGESQITGLTVTSNDASGSTDVQTKKVGDQQQLIVTAKYSDGSTRDVTWLTQFASNDAGLVEVDSHGKLKVLRHGETAVRAHYQGQVAVQVISVPFDRPAVAQAPNTATRGNFIDDHVFAKLTALRIPASAAVSDEAFIRRVFLDTIGTLPTEAEVEAFLADARSDKRAQFIESLLQRPEFVDLWTMLMADLFQNRKERDHDVRGVKGVRAFHQWLRSQVAANRPWNELVRAVLTSSGDSDQHPEVGYYVVTIGEFRQTQQSDVVASVAQAFLGTRIGCAKCHNHPLEKYTQDDYYHFAAFFSRVAFDRQSPQMGKTDLIQATEHQQNQQRHRANLQKQLAEKEATPIPEKEEDAKKREQQLTELRKQIEGVAADIERVRMSPITVGQPRTNEQLKAQPLDRANLAIELGSDPRVALVDWMTSGRNESFNGSIVNRIWQHYMGVGLVEPVDDIRASNPPSNPPLWKVLNEDFAAHGFDMKQLMRTILNSRTYQTSSETLAENEADTKFYSHYYARRLPAELLLDAFSQVTAIPDQFPGYPEGLRAQQLADPGLDSYFLRLFGRSDRVTACACERQGDVTMSQLLHLQNGDTISRKIEAGNGYLAEMLKSTPDNAAAINRLFMTTLSRKPNQTEINAITSQLSQGSREDVFRDLMWALLNSKEFSFNH
ncbi:MAG: hypothetical protein JWP89_5480 [Schlesneria sp.]|nr:hypothetical protein [Schlesneria sp.]